MNKCHVPMRERFYIRWKPGGHHCTVLTPDYTSPIPSDFHLATPEDLDRVAEIHRERAERRAQNNPFRIGY